jgi:predicted secreted protein
MGLVSGVFVYLLIWWTLVFCVLPFGNKPEIDIKIGEAPSAPQNPRIKQKFIITSIVAFAIWLLIYISFEFGWLNWNELVRSYNKELTW